MYKAHVSVSGITAVKTVPPLPIYMHVYQYAAYMKSTVITLTTEKNSNYCTKVPLEEQNKQQGFSNHTGKKTGNLEVHVCVFVIFAAKFFL